MSRPFEQLSFANLQPEGAPRAEGRERRGSAPAAKVRPPCDQLELPLPPALDAAPRIAVLAGGGSGSGHRRARLVALDGGGAPGRPLPTRDEITTALLGGLADLVAGRISPAGASALREAAENALRQLDAAERDPHRAPQFVRAARALQELL